jgi:hypothetical protein
MVIQHMLCPVWKMVVECHQIIPAWHNGPVDI